MLRASFVALIFCFACIVNQANAQCSSAGYTSHYQPNSYHSTSSYFSYYPSNSLSTCSASSYNNNGISMPVSSYPPSLAGYQTAPAKLPTPVFAQSIPAMHGSVNPTVSANTAYSAPVNNSYRVQQPGSINFGTGFYFNYNQPTCAGGNCNYRQ